MGVRGTGRVGRAAIVGAFPPFRIWEGGEGRAAPPPPFLPPAGAEKEREGRAGSKGEGEKRGGEAK